MLRKRTGDATIMLGDWKYVYLKESVHGKHICKKSSENTKNAIDWVFKKNLNLC